MKNLFRFLTVSALAINALGIYAPAAMAAAPANDVFAGAALVTAGYSELLNTTEATTDADDAQLNTLCGAPATDASVWYAIEGTDTAVVVDVSSSDYSAGVLVGVGSQGALNVITCGAGAVAFWAAAGTTYYVLAIDDQLNGDGLNGGNLNISFSEIAAPTVSLTVNRTGKVNTRTGIATISGTYTCDHSDIIDVSVDARQPVGRFTIIGSGEFFDFDTCDGTAHKWSAQIYPQNGKFAGGKTATVSFAYACGASECATGYVEQKVQLSGGK